MVRNLININGQSFVFDIYKANIDFDERHTEKFVLLRSYEVMNEIINDRNIYVVQKSVLEEWFDNKNNGLVFPVSNGSYTGFSTDPEQFSDQLNEVNFYKGSNEIYELYNRNSETQQFEETEILCDKIRIYHPHTVNYYDSVIHIDNYINSIHFHWLCRRLDSFDNRGISDEFKIDNSIYSEYVEFWIPSAEQLLSRDIFFRDDVNITNIVDWSDEYYVEDERVSSDPERNPLQTDVPEYILTERSNSYWYEYDKSLVGLIWAPNKPASKNDVPYVSTLLFSFPFVIDEFEPGKFQKKYIPQLRYTMKLDYVAYPIKVMMFPYSYIDETTNLYIENENIHSNSDMFNSDSRFILTSKIGFNDQGVISVLNIFDYPNKKAFSSFRDAYQYYYGVDLIEYEGIIDDSDEDYDEDNPIDQKQCGFLIEMFSDYKVKNCIYRQYFEIEKPNEELDDFSFSLNNIVTDWNQMPDLIVGRCRFIDKYLGTFIDGNGFVITKEWFKYMVDDTQKSRALINGTQEKLEFKKDMDLSKFNFINNVTCVIKRNVEDSADAVAQRSSQPRILYKPIFYRAFDLQTINIKSMLKQNVGINLAEYMTKVESFKMVINDMHIVEYARNDVYTIFQIDASQLTAESGEYHILNQDGEYISSGKWSLK